MSVGLLISKKGQERGQGRYVPVASQEDFVQHWVPAARSLGLSWVPLFETGVPLTVGDVPAVIAELHLLEEWLARASPSVIEGISGRLRNLIRELNLLFQGDDFRDAEVFIG